MGRVWVSAVVLFAAGVASADEPGWQPTGQPTPAAPSLPSAPIPPASPAPADAPAWGSPRADGPVWQPVAQTTQPPMTPPAAPPKAEPLPAPKPAPPAEKSKTELPAVTAPPIVVWGNGPPVAGPVKVLEPHPEGAIPHAGGVPVRHKTFGSPNLTLSRDYHFLDLFGLSLLGDDADTQVLGEGPAEDRFFVQAEYLLWWVRRGNVPALTTTAPEPGNPNGNFGFLGQPGTTVLLGPGGFGDTLRDGFRFRAGAWFDGPGGLGVDGSYFFLGRQVDRFEVNSTQFPVIARPFSAPNLNPVTGAPFGEFGEVVAGGGTRGALQVVQSSFLWGADLNLRNCVCRTCSSRNEWFVGYRHLNLRESLTITEFITAGPNDAPLPPGTGIIVRDDFRTHNRFHGGQVGYAIGRRRGRVDVDARVSVALGVTAQTLDITGGQQVAVPGAAPAQFSGGLLAVGPNLGSFDRSEFSVVPEVTVNVGYLLSPTTRVYIGYNFLYWTNVLRPGDQIDRVVDLTFVPNGPPVAPSGQARPQPTFRQSDLWAQGLQFGIELRW